MADTNPPFIRHPVKRGKGYYARPVRQIRVVDDVAYVSLTKGYEAVIDAADVPLVEAFYWHARPRGRTVYAVRSERTDGEHRTIYMHRTLLNHLGGTEVDHRDGDGLNNCRDNLRLATRSQNSYNARLSLRNKSGFKGVHWECRRKKWRARIVVSGRIIFLGYYASPEAAHAAYAEAAKRLHGDFARVG